MDLSIQKLVENNPVVKDAAQHRETAWLNPSLQPWETLRKDLTLTGADIADASARLARFAPYIMRQFPETAATNGLIESPLREIPRMRQQLKAAHPSELGGRLFLKMDSHLAIAGSIKARGGIYEILKYAESLALANGMLKETDDYSILASDSCRDFFSRYTIQVGSTGNLGMSIGIISAKLGFRVIVHMSNDAKQWKKDLLRSRGAQVVEYASDYCAAVEQGRKNSDANPMSYFVDDENSKDLFLGYSVAAERLIKQLAEQQVPVDSQHPLFVYLPCGIGGAPGGVAFGLKQQFGDAVHCFFTEPVEACCMLLGVATGLHDQISIADFGISGKTHADGLAVGRPSAFVGRFIQPMLSGIFTIQDARLYDWMRMLMESEQIFIEPSACAAFAAAAHPEVVECYIRHAGLDGVRDQITHVAWATGGSMVPPAMVETYANTHL